MLQHPHPRPTQASQAARHGPRFRRAQRQSPGRRTRPWPMAGLAARPRGSRTRRPATDLQAPQRPPAPSRGLYRGCRLPGFPTPRQSPLPATGARQMDRRQTEPDRHWSLRRRQIMGSPARSARRPAATTSPFSTSAFPGCSPSSKQGAPTDATPACSVLSPRPISSSSTIGDPTASAPISDATSWKSSRTDTKNAAILITSQLPVDKWHDVIGEPTFADAILDRIVHNAHRINLDGPSMRKTIAENFNANDVDHAERK